MVSVLGHISLINLISQHHREHLCAQLAQYSLHFYAYFECGHNFNDLTSGFVLKKCGQFLNLMENVTFFLWYNVLQKNWFISFGQISSTQLNPCALFNLLFLIVRLSLLLSTVETDYYERMTNDSKKKHKKRTTKIRQTNCTRCVALPSYSN